MSSGWEAEHAAKASEACLLRLACEASSRSCAADRLKEHPAAYYVYEMSFQVAGESVLSSYSASPLVSMEMRPLGSTKVLVSPSHAP